MTNGIPVCIECGGPTNELNEDESGAPCPACSERLLETLPGVFHAPWGQGGRAEPTLVDDEVPVRESEALPGPGSAHSRRSPETFDDPREPA